MSTIQSNNENNETNKMRRRISL